MSLQLDAADSSLFHGNAQDLHRRWWLVTHHAFKQKSACGTGHSWLKQFSAFALRSLTQRGIGRLALNTSPFHSLAILGIPIGHAHCVCLYPGVHLPRPWINFLPLHMTQIQLSLVARNNQHQEGHRGEQSLSQGTAGWTAEFSEGSTVSCTIHIRLQLPKGLP